MLVEAAGRYLLLGVHREPHLLLRCLHGCWRRRRLFGWAFHRVRVGFICESRRLSRPLFSFFVAVLGARCVAYQTKISAAERVADPGRYVEVAMRDSHRAP